jgi:hypothetical protein
VSSLPSDDAGDDDDFSDSVSDSSFGLNLLLSLPSSSTTPSLEIDIAQAADLSDHASRGFNIDYIGRDFSYDGLGTDVISITPAEGTDGLSIATAEGTSSSSTRDVLDMIGTSDGSEPFMYELECCISSKSQAAPNIPAHVSPPSSILDYLEPPSHEDATTSDQGPDGPLSLCLLPLASALPSLDRWYSPMDTRESCQIWHDIFGQERANSQERCAERPVETNTGHTLPGRSENYRDIGPPHCNGVSPDIRISRSTSSMPPPHSPRLPRLDIPNWSLIEELSAISPLFSPSDLTKESCDTYPCGFPSSPTGSASFPRRHISIRAQRTLFPITGGHHESNVRRSQSERGHRLDKDPYVQSMSVTPSFARGEIRKNVRTKPRHSPMITKRHRSVKPSPAVHRAPKSTWEKISSLFLPEIFSEPSPELRSRRAALQIEITDRALILIPDGPLTSLTET